MDYMGDMAEGSVTIIIAWASGKLYKLLKIFNWERTKEMSVRVTRHHIALGSGLVPDCTGLRGREKLELYQMHKSREMWRNWLAEVKKQVWSKRSVPCEGLEFKDWLETKMIKYLEIMPDSWKQKNE